MNKFNSTDILINNKCDQLNIKNYKFQNYIYNIIITLINK